MQGDIYDFYDLQVDYGALSFFFNGHRVYVVVSLSFSLHFLLCSVY